ncbi:hypothetical protein O181_067368 [Austropuccinia psidii MF-1]|uniref:Integrase zinc-binding domain-containing protein n=1 Tax=Austropuccinia psidii MF-1 TaxID=1389203 RepID=A0A9Q3EYN9_9BASI|nr:hypothetical protein [Austropuccinia psidii MF-1]
MDNVKSNPADDPEVAAKIPIQFMEIDAKRNFRFSEWAPEGGTLDSANTDSEGAETFILLEEPWLRAYKDNKFFLVDGLLYHRTKHTSALTVVDRDHISLILQECHDCPYMGHMSEDRTKDRVASTAWWPKCEQELSEYINTCERFQKENKKHGKKYGLPSTNRWPILKDDPDNGGHPWKVLCLWNGIQGP